MIDIIVMREPGDLQGEDIVNPLITSELCAVARGTTEINRNTLSSLVDMHTVYRTGVMPGQTAETYDAIYGETWRGKVVGVSHTYTKFSKTTKLSLHKYRPAP